MALLQRLAPRITVPLVGVSTSRSLQIVPLPAGWSMNDLIIYPPAGWYRLTLKVAAGTPHLWLRDSGVTIPVDARRELTIIEKLSTQGVSVSNKDMPDGTEGVLVIERL